MLINSHTQYTGSQALREWARQIQTGEVKWVNGEPDYIGECCAGFGCVIHWDHDMTQQDINEADPWSYTSTYFLGGLYWHIQHIESQMRQLMDSYVRVITGGEMHSFTEWNDVDGRHVNEVVEFLIECANLCREQGL